jgi:hypothetical protein
MCYMPTKSFHNKSMRHVTCVKKQKFDAKSKAFDMTNFVSRNGGERGDEVLTRQCPYLGAFDSWEERVGSGELDGDR